MSRIQDKCEVCGEKMFAQDIDFMLCKECAKKEENILKNDR